MNSEKNKTTVFLTREFFNSLLSVLSAIIAADEDSIYGYQAKKLKKKIMKNGRIISNKGEENVAIHFFETETAVIIKLLILYSNAIGNTKDIYFDLLKNR